MKQKISYNTVLSWLSVIYFIAFVAIFVLFWVFINKPYDNVFFWILVGLCALGVCWIFGSIPDSVYSDDDDDYVSYHRPFYTKRYHYRDIQSAAPANKDEDRRIHFHGRYKNPVLITLKDGRQYVIGSENAQELSDYINNRVNS